MAKSGSNSTGKSSIRSQDYFNRERKKRKISMERIGKQQTQENSSSVNRRRDRYHSKSKSKSKSKSRNHRVMTSGFQKEQRTNYLCKSTREKDDKEKDSVNVDTERETAAEVSNEKKRENSNNKEMGDNREISGINEESIHHSRDNSRDIRSRDNVSFRSRSSDRSSQDTSDSHKIIHFDWREGEYIDKYQRYKCVKLLGDGTFGRVVLCKDRDTDRDASWNQRYKAVKIIRDVKRYQDSAKIEADILRDVERKRRRLRLSSDEICIVKLTDVFRSTSNLLCIVFEPLGSSLYELIKANGYRGLYMSDLQIMATDILMGLDFCHNKMGLTHTDLKPENILFKKGTIPVKRSNQSKSHSRHNNENSRDCGFEYIPLRQLPNRMVTKEELRKNEKNDRNQFMYMRPYDATSRLIDFGNSTFYYEHHSSTINTRQYRGPEVITGKGWDEQSDMWSFGCILCEAYMGDLLFPTHDNLEHLHMMESILGPIPPSVLNNLSRDGRTKLLVYNESEDHYSIKDLSDGKMIENVAESQPLRRLIDRSSKGHSDLLDLISGCLEYDPKRRYTPKEALRHRFFRHDYKGNQ